jgi:hypothetical protein
MVLSDRIKRACFMVLTVWIGRGWPYVSNSYIVSGEVGFMILTARIGKGWPHRFHTIK